MMTHYFNSPERVARLLYHANGWIGTPWCANSNARGGRGGVSCHNLPRALYLECGALPPGYPLVLGDPNGTRHKKDSVIEPFIDACPEFLRLQRGVELLPGDLVGFRIYHCLDHLGVMVDPTSFIHVLMHKKTDIDMIRVSPWSERMMTAWRPLN